MILKHCLEAQGTTNGFETFITQEHINILRKLTTKQAIAQYTRASQLENDLIHIYQAHQAIHSPEKRLKYIQKVKYSKDKSRTILKDHFDTFRSDTPEGQDYLKTIQKTAEILDLTWD